MINSSEFKHLSKRDVCHLTNVYKHMRQRCCNPSNRDYPYYGGRGISICNEWHPSNPEGRNNFLEWADSHYCEGLTIDRIDNDGSYSPQNCRFADTIMQANNRRNNHRLNFCGRTHTIAEWSTITGIPASTLRVRLYRGWSVTRTLSTPLHRKKKNT